MRASARPAFPPPLVVIAELVGAVLGGATLSAVAGYGLGLLLLGSGLGMGLLSLQVFAAVIGFGAGAGLGAALAGRLLGQRGSAWLAAGAGMVSGGLVILLMRLVRVGGLFEILGVGVAVVLIAAVLAYNRRPHATATNTP